MKTVLLEVEPGNDAYLLALLLAQAGADYDQKAYDWSVRPGTKGDELYVELQRLSKWLYQLSGSVAKQTKLT